MNWEGADDSRSSAVVYAYVINLIYNLYSKSLSSIKLITNIYPFIYILLLIISISNVIPKLSQLILNCSFFFTIYYCRY